MWLHADPIHLGGNMLFLWLFGNAVCAKVGNLKFIPIYLMIGLGAAVYLITALLLGVRLHHLKTEM